MDTANDRKLGVCLGITTTRMINNKQLVSVIVNKLGSIIMIPMCGSYITRPQPASGHQYPQ